MENLTWNPRLSGQIWHPSHLHHPGQDHPNHDVLDIIKMAESVLVQLQRLSSQPQWNSKDVQPKMTSSQIVVSLSLKQGVYSFPKIESLAVPKIVIKPEPVSKFLKPSGHLQWPPQVNTKKSRVLPYLSKLDGLDHRRRSKQGSSSKSISRMTPWSSSVVTRSSQCLSTSVT